MKASEMIDDALLLLGEDPTLCLHDTGAEGGGCTLRRRIIHELVPCAVRAVETTPRMRLTGWRRLTGERLTIDPGGRGVLPLPQDFLRLHSVRMASWSYPVEEVLDAGHWLRRLQGSGWHGLRGSPQRPLVFEGVAADGERGLELFSCAEGDTVAEGWYMPAPAVDAAGNIELPPAAYRRCLDYIVESLRM